jgi:hypothetical protein
VRRDDAQFAVAVEEAVVDHPRDRQRRVEREADRRGQLEADHVHRVDAGRAPSDARAPEAISRRSRSISARTRDP